MSAYRYEANMQEIVWEGTLLANAGKIFFVIATNSTSTRPLMIQIACIVVSSTQTAITLNNASQLGYAFLWYPFVNVN